MKLAKIKGTTRAKVLLTITDSIASKTSNRKASRFTFPTPLPPIKIFSPLRVVLLGELDIKYFFKGAFK